MPVDTKRERELTFWRSCLPNRIAIASAMVIADIQRIKILQIILALYMGNWAIGFFVYFSRTHFSYKLQERIQNAQGQERIELKNQLHEATHGNFGGVVWWQWHRLVHGILLFCYSLLTLLDLPYAYVFAIADVAYGFIAGLFYYRLRDCKCGMSVEIT